MKRMMVLVLVLVALAAGGAEAQQTNALELYKKSMAMQERVLLGGYGESLDALMGELKKQGNLEAYLTVEAEKKRFGTNRVVVLPSEANMVFNFQVCAYYRNLVKLMRNYVEVLGGLLRDEMVADRIAGAKAVDEEKKRAEFLLADLCSKLPKELVAVPASRLAGVRVELPSAAAKHTVPGKWTSWNGLTVFFHKDGRLEVPGNRDWSGKWSYVDLSRTKVRRTCNNGVSDVLAYDAEKDTLVEAGGQAFQRVSE